MLVDRAAIGDEGEAAQRMFTFGTRRMPDIKCTQIVSLSRSLVGRFNMPCAIPRDFS
jgi:hypothetical protein